MNRKILCSLLIITLFFQCNAFSKKAEASELLNKIPSGTVLADKKDNELIVTYRNDSAKRISLPEGAAEEVLTDTCSLVTLEEKDLKEAIESLVFDKDTLYVEPNYILSSQYTLDTYSDKQWAYYNTENNINIENAWDLGKGKDGEVTVAVIDTGIDYQHVDLKEHMWMNTDEILESTKDNDKNGYPGDYYGWNFLDDTALICEYEYSKEEKAFSDYHGTHVAGIIAASADNGVGIAGVAGYSNVSLMSLKVIDNVGNAEVAKIIKAIEYAQENGAAICNMSLGTDGYSKSLYQIIRNSSMLFVCAAGNGNESSGMIGFDVTKKPLYPAAFDLDNVISVANANSQGDLDVSSCYSSENVDIAAPGTAIVSTYVDEKHSEKGIYVELTGTSMAAPYVSGTAALILSYYGEMTAEELKERILGGGKKIAVLEDKVKDGIYLDVMGAITYPFLSSQKIGISLLKSSQDQEE